MSALSAHDKANDLDAYWMPFTANRQFKANPRMVVGADGMHFKLSDGRDLMDGIAGLWCCNAGTTGRVSLKRYKSKRLNLIILQPSRWAIANSLN